MIRKDANLAVPTSQALATYPRDTPRSATEPNTSAKPTQLSRNCGGAIAASPSNTVREGAPTMIDLVDPSQACRSLSCDANRLIELVNNADLPAYLLAGQIRFRYSDLHPLVGRPGVPA